MNSALRVRECTRLCDVGHPETWNALTARVPAVVSGSRAWVAAAFETVHQTAVPCLLAVETNSRLVGLLPLALHEPTRAPTLRFAGAPHNDLADLLVLPGYEQAAARAAVKALAAAAALGRSVELEDVDPDGSLANADPSGYALTWAPHDPAPLIDLQGGWMQAISRRRNKRWHRALRQLGERHLVEFRWLERHEAVDALPDFVRLRIARLRATSRPVGRPQVWAFVERVIQQLAPLGQCAFAEMRIDRRPVALDLHVIQQPVSMLWLRALDPAWRRFPCGHLLLLTTAERLEQTGYVTLDLGRGDEPYKFVFGAHRRTLHKATLSPQRDANALDQHRHEVPE